MIQKIKRYIKENKLISQNDHIIVGISGGADSVSLLMVLKKLSEELDFSLEAVHVEHGIRGEESLEDAGFTRAFCEKTGVEMHMVSVNVPLYATEKSLGYEEAARILRYQVFEERIRETGGKVALAHHMDDNAETILFQMLRGSGIKGMRGMLPRRDNYIRPFLCVTRAEIEEYLAENSQEYRIDSTNKDTEYSRNLIRCDVFPLLKNVNNQAVSHINQSALQLMDIWEYIDQQVQKEVKRIVDTTDQDKVVLKGDELLMLHSALQGEVALESIAIAAGRRKDITSLHVQALLELAQGQSGRRISLPYGLVAYKEYDSIFICDGVKTSVEKETLKDKFLNNYSVTKEQLEECRNTHGKLEILLGDGDEKIVFGVVDFDGNMEKIPKKPYTKWLDYGKIKSDFQVRRRMAGDYFISDKEGHKKKLKDYFINEKIPASVRDEIWLLADGSEIISIIGGRMNEIYKVCDNTVEVLEVRYDGGK